MARVAIVTKDNVLYMWYCYKNMSYAFPQYKYTKWDDRNLIILTVTNILKCISEYKLHAFNMLIFCQLYFNK